MVYFDADERGLILEYEPEFNSPSWVSDELKEKGEVTVSRAFTFVTRDLLNRRSKRTDEDPIYRFRFAKREAGYFRIPGRVLGCEHDVLISSTEISFERKTFVAERNVGIFRRVARVMEADGEIVVGGDRAGAIPAAVFRELLSKFPSSIELDRYASARVETILGEYLKNTSEAREKYERYLHRRGSVVPETQLPHTELIEAELGKYQLLREMISGWLASSASYSEKDWQRLILKVVLLLLPKYVAVLENVQIIDAYSAPGQKKKRFIDVCLIDAGGNLDVVEVKKPFDDALLSKSLYRGNSIPSKELSGAIMQAEKYLFHLSKWGVDGEAELTKRHAKQLPPAMQIRITNPKALLLLGRDMRHSGAPAFSEQQKFDLEVIKRKYANMMDILTYDDLLRRLDNIIASLSQRRAALA